MTFKLTVTFLLSLALCCFSFIQNEPVPDPSLFGKHFVEVLKQNNEQAYIQAFSLSNEEWLGYYNQSKSNPYLSEDEKSKITLNKLEYLKSHWNSELKDSYKRITQWSILDSIDISKIEYVDIDYKLILDEKDNPNYRLTETYILIKYEDQLYRIRSFYTEYINNKWVYGRISSIDKVDAYLHEIKKLKESTAVNDTDSLIIFPISNQKKLSKHDSLKVVKLQNKIDDIYKK